MSIAKRSNGAYTVQIDGDRINGRRKKSLLELSIPKEKPTVPNVTRCKIETVGLT